MAVRSEVRREVSRIRKTAARLLKHLKVKRAAAKSARRGANVDAPGKRHRKPPPQEKVKRGASASAVKKLGKKSPTTPRKFL